MKKSLTLTLAAACFLTTSAAQAALNLVQDPGFESVENGALTGGSSPWFSPNSTAAINTSNPFAGNYNAVLTGTSALLFQDLTLTAGIGYTVNFWIAAPSAGGTLEVVLNGTVAGMTPVSSESSYREYNWTATPVNASGILEFVWSGSTSSTPLDVDNVSVAVPEPTTMIAGALMLLPFAASTFRLRKKSAA
jgi:hypothetical protein